MILHTITRADGTWVRDPDQSPVWTSDPAEAGTYTTRQTAESAIEKLHHSGFIPEGTEMGIQKRGTVSYIPAAAVHPRERHKVPGHDHVDWVADFVPRMEGAWLTCVAPEILPEVMAENGWFLVDDSAAPGAFTFEQAA